MRALRFVPAEALQAIFGTVNPLPNIPATWNMAPTRDAPVVRLHRETRGAQGAGPESRASADQRPGRKCRHLVNVPRRSGAPPLPGGGKTRIPWAVARADGQSLALAGLWEGWRGASGEVLRTFVIVTTPASEAPRALHDPMPAVLEPADWPLWLGEVEGEAPALLRPSKADLRLWRVSPAVNDVRNDTEGLLNQAV